MAIAFSAIVPVEKRAPANPVAPKGNTAYTRQFRVTIPVSTTAAALVIGQLPPGTLVQGVVFDTNTSLGSSTLVLATSTSTFVASTTLTATGGKQQTIATKLGVAVPSSATADADLTLTLGTATSPASIVVLDVTLMLSSIGPVASSFSTFDT
jgi:hypothetical protein